MPLQMLLYMLPCVQLQSRDICVQTLSSLQALAHIYTQTLLGDRRTQLNQYDKSCAGAIMPQQCFPSPSRSHLQLSCLINLFSLLMSKPCLPLPCPFPPVPPTARLPPPHFRSCYPQVCTIPCTLYRHPQC